MKTSSKKNERSNYYEIMGVSKGVTPEELKKAYRRKALQLHPDKNPGNEEAFTRMKHCYDVLSDPKRKEIYDMMGEEGVKAMDDFSSVTPEQMHAMAMNAIVSSSTSKKLCGLLLLNIFIGFFLLIPIFWCLRIDLTVGWNWATVFVPLWILDTFAFCCLGCSFCEDNSSSDEDTEDTTTKTKVLAKIYTFIKALLLLILQVFVVLRLNNTVSWNMFSVLAPYFVWEGVRIPEKMYAASVAFRAWKDSSNNSTTESKSALRSLMSVVAYSFLRSLLRITLGVLIALKIDDDIDVSWYIVFIPVWLVIAFHVGHTIFKYISRKNTSTTSSNNDDADTGHDAYTRSDSEARCNEEEASGPMSKAALFCNLLILGVFVSPVFILVARLQDGDFSSFYIALPWFCVLALFVSMFSCLILCAKGSEDTQGDGSGNGSGAGPAASEESRPAAASSSIYSQPTNYSSVDNNV